MGHGRLHIGTSGWGYREWQGGQGFYPITLAPARFLEHYVKHFAAVEANSTAYGLPTPETVQRWSTMLPPGFVMALKAPQTITHRARLRGCQKQVNALLACVRILDGHLGPLLFQLPPSMGPDTALLRDFLAEARTCTATLPLICEFRDPGWYRDDVFAILDDAGAAACLHDMAGSELTTPRNTSILYLRKHGTGGERYAGTYGPEKLTQDADMLVAWLASGRDAYAFFNNTMHGEALADARLLRELVQTRLGNS